MGNEIGAMGAIDKAMTELDEDEARRVLTWAVDKFAPGDFRSSRSQSKGEKDGGGSSDGSSGNGRQAETGGSYDRISDLMDEASPTSIVEWVLVASYWYQVIQGHENFSGQEVNSDLKDLGHGSKNITDSYNSLIKRKPPLVRQVEKTGRSKQARKKYRLTTEGVRTVERMIQGNGDED
ncbi:MAG TPA: hypothetical protein VNC16_03005 [Solirubrobacterales bacterium]|jgi:hypothetical protein|nr:hypothetical protein [Solirubrobacterales bacterium]